MSCRFCPHPRIPASSIQTGRDAHTCCAKHIRPFIETYQLTRPAISAVFLYLEAQCGYEGRWSGTQPHHPAIHTPQRQLKTAASPTQHKTQRRAAQAQTSSPHQNFSNQGLLLKQPGGEQQKLEPMATGSCAEKGKWGSGLARSEWGAGLTTRPLLGVQVDDDVAQSGLQQNRHGAGFSATIPPAQVTGATRS